MADWHLAQLNVARARFPLDDPRLAEFVDNLDRINALADTSPGFIWRLQSDAGNATDIQVSDDPLLIVNMSVWTGRDVLFEYVYKTAHRGIMARRRDWFERPDAAYQVLWWVPADPARFNFKTVFPPGGGPATDMNPELHCVGWR